MGISRPTYLFFCYAVAGNGISGGDRIFCEFAKRWCKLVNITIHTGLEGKRLLARQKVKHRHIKTKIFNNSRFLDHFLVNYLIKIYQAIKVSLNIDLSNSSGKIYIYSASEFWMDSLPAWILKIRYPKVVWLASWYQTAPNPLKGFAEIRREEAYRLQALYLWLAQLPIKPLVSNWADYVLVNNEVEKNTFPKLNLEKRVIVVLGAVHSSAIAKWRKSHKFKSKYAAVFQGRFHPQKGVVELITIWRLVVNKIPEAKLVLIGDGPLMPAVKAKIAQHNLQNNVLLKGFVFDGDKKYTLFAQSKLVVHPAFFDSGGMASAEAMAFGIPVVAFNLKAYRSYYPQGMIKAKAGSLKDFANKVIELLNDSKARNKLGNQALRMINATWSWERRAKQIYEHVMGKVLSN